MKSGQRVKPTCTSQPEIDAWGFNADVWDEEVADADSSDEMADEDGSDKEDTDDSDVEEATLDGLVTEESDMHRQLE